MMKHSIWSNIRAAFFWVAPAVFGVALAGPGQFRFEAQPGPYAVGLTPKCHDSYRLNSSVIMGALRKDDGSIRQRIQSTCSG